MAEIPERWILYFEDVDKKGWHFDDRQAAQETLKLQLQSWSCHLFVNAEQLGAAEARIRELEQERDRAKPPDRWRESTLSRYDERAQIKLELGAAEEALTDLTQRFWNACESSNQTQAQLQAVTQERDDARKSLIAVGRNLGCLLADTVSTDFLGHLPEEVSLRNKEFAQLQARNSELTNVLRVVRGSGVACSFMSAEELAQVDAALKGQP